MYQLMCYALAEITFYFIENCYSAKFQNVKTELDQNVTLYRECDNNLKETQAALQKQQAKSKLTISSLQGQLEEQSKVRVSVKYLTAEYISIATRQNLTQAKCTMFRKHKKLFQNNLETECLLLLFLSFL